MFGVVQDSRGVFLELTECAKRKKKDSIPFSPC